MLRESDLVGILAPKKKRYLAPPPAPPSPCRRPRGTCAPPSRLLIGILLPPSLYLPPPPPKKITKIIRPEYSRVRELNPNIFFSNFRAFWWDIPAKFRDIPPKKFDSLGFEGHTELFGPHPFTWKTPTPPENIRTQKV